MHIGAQILQLQDLSWAVDSTGELRAHAQGSFDMHTQHTESEGYDRSSLELPGMQETFVRLLARLTPTPLIVVLVHGAPPRASLPRTADMQMRTTDMTWG